MICPDVHLAQVLLRADRAALRDALVSGTERYVALVDADCSNAAQLIDRLVDELQATGAAVAVASPFMHGGRLIERSWWLRMFASMNNRFLSLATHGALFSFVGTVCVFERRTLAEAIAECPGRDIGSEILLECRRRGVRIIEVPAEVRHDRALGASRLTASVVAWKRLLACMRTGLRYRPALWLAVPGLIPGLLPLVATVLLIVRPAPAVAAALVAATLIVQYGSFAIFSWQTTSFVAKIWQARRRA